MKTSGLTDHLYVGGYDVSGDIGAVQTVNSKRALIDATGLDVAAIERLYGLYDGELSFNNWFEGDAALGVHELLKTLPDADRQALYFRGTLLGYPVACIIGKELTYSLVRAGEGAMTGSIQVLASGDAGLEWGESLAAGKVTSLAAEYLVGLDSGIVGGTPGDLSAYLQVFAFVGTDVTFEVEDSVDGDIDIAADDNALVLITNLINDHVHPLTGVGYSPLHTRIVTVDIVDTAASIVAGTVRLTGTDAAGAPLTDDVDISAGAGSYVSAVRFKTVTQVKTLNDVVVLGGAGDEKITVGVQALVSTYGALGSFAQTVAAPGVQHLVFAGPVKRYLRVSVTTAGGFATVTFAIAAVR